jgi:hypothetical protein
MRSVVGSTVPVTATIAMNDPPMFHHDLALSSVTLKKD